MKVRPSDEHVEELRVILEEEFNEPWTFSDARVAADNMFQLYLIANDTYKKMSPEEQEEVRRLSAELDDEPPTPEASSESE